MSALARATALNVISMSDVKMPEPLVPPGTRVGGDYMPLYCGAILNSEALAAMPPAARWAALRLWLEAWRSEHTTGTLPNNDKLLAQFAGYGNDMRSWLRIKQNALHKFVLCSDGRLHHPVLAKAVRDLLERRAKANKRKRDQRRPERDGGAEKPEESGQMPDACPAPAGNLPGTCRVDGGDLPNREGQNQTLSDGCHAPVPQEGKGREGKGIEGSVSPDGDTGEPPTGDPPDAPSAPAAFDPKKHLWSEARRILPALGIADAESKAGKALAGRLIGKWLKDLGDDCIALLHILRDAEAMRPVGDAAAWVSAAVQARKRGASAKASGGEFSPDPTLNKLAQRRAAQIAEAQLRTRTIEGEAEEIREQRA